MKVIRNAAGNRLIPLSAKEIAKLAKLLMNHHDKCTFINKENNNLVKRFVLYDHLENRR